jgi:hypothetical protein
MQIKFAYNQHFEQMEISQVVKGIEICESINHLKTFTEKGEKKVDLTFNPIN